MRSSQDQLPYAFVVMPFALRHEYVYERIIAPALGKIGWKVDRMDKEDHLALITKRVIEKILEADLIIAVVSGTNQNVMYELGVSHTFKKPTLILTRNFGRYPFDLAQLFAMTYPHPKATEEELEAARQRIASLVVAVWQGARTDNPVSALVPNAFDIIFPIHPYDQLLYSCNSIKEKSNSVQAAAVRFRRVSETVQEYNAPRTGFLSSLRETFAKFSLAIYLLTFISSLRDSLRVFAREVPGLKSDVTLARQLCAALLRHNQRLHQTLTCIKDLIGYIITVESSIRTVSRDFEMSFDFLEEGSYLSLRFLLKLVPSKFLDLFFGPGGIDQFKQEVADDLKALLDIGRELENDIQNLTRLQEECTHKLSPRSFP